MTVIIAQHPLACQAENPPYGRRATGCRRASPISALISRSSPSSSSRRNDRPGRRRAHSATGRGPGRMKRRSAPVAGRRRVPAFPSWPVSLPSGPGRPSRLPGRTVEGVLGPNSRHEENAFRHDKSDSRSRPADFGDGQMVRPGEGLRFPRSGQRLVRHLLPGAGLDRGRPRHLSPGSAGRLRDGAGRARTGGVRPCPAMPAAYARGSSGRAARPPASATAHDRRAHMMTTKGLDDDA